MDKYICKAKRKDNGEWVEGYYVCLNGNCHFIYTGYAETDCGYYYPDYHEVIPETVEQCTGLTDFQDGLDENRDLFKKEVEPEIRNEVTKEFVGKLTDKISVYSNHVDVDGIVILNRIYRMIEDIEKEMTEVQK